MLYVDEETSVARQLERAKIASLHNRRAMDAGGHWFGWFEGVAAHYFIQVEWKQVVLRQNSQLAQPASHGRGWAQVGGFVWRCGVLW